jgi:hypothetical protein
MRERTTWNRADIQKQAASMSRRAEDPTAMNQDHLSQQPKADKYITGDPSTFAEDIHPNDWSVEYSGGQTSRNEIGMPEMRKDTFNHPEKTAALDEETLVKKADLCCKVARQILGPKAVEAAIEDQALALMNLSDSDLIATVNRMAQDQGQDQDDQGQKQAQDQGQQDQGQDQAKQAKDLPPEFLENIQKKKDEAKDKDDKKEAGVKLGQLEAMAQQLQTMMGQIQQMMQQQGQQQVQQVVEQAPQQVEQQSNDQMIDQMLSQQQQAPMQEQANDFGIQMDSPQMDIGEVGMGPEDDVLQTLFANNAEVQNAQQAHTLQHGAPASMQFQASGSPMARTASTRTVGTRPSGGVASIGGLGSPAPSQSGGDVEKLSHLWNSAPDVSDVFRS